MVAGVIAGRSGLGTEAMGKNYDVAVIGAGVFGSWTAYHLKKAGQRVTLLDAYGPANSRASSGGESRIIRVGYGADELYSRWSLRSLELWQAFFQQAGQRLFHKTGVIWLARGEDPYTLKTLATLTKLGVPHERLSRSELEARYPQIAFGPVTWAVLERDSGVLMARRAVQAVAEEMFPSGADFRQEAVAAPTGKGRLASVTTQGGETVSAGHFVFACGPWLPKVFPDLLRNRIVPTRQPVLFFGVSPGDRRFMPPVMPTWIDFGEQIYGIPDLENRGFKIALDHHGPPFDPDQDDRVVTREEIAAAREFLGRRFPALKDAPLLEARVCQYENTSNGDFLIDHHPDFDNVWLVGGGSGHGFKHGPAVGEYVAERITKGGSIEPRFSLATKETLQKRSVF